MKSSNFFSPSFNFLAVEPPMSGVFINVHLHLLENRTPHYLTLHALINSKDNAYNLHESVRRLLLLKGLSSSNHINWDKLITWEVYILMCWSDSSADYYLGGLSWGEKMKETYFMQRCNGRGRMTSGIALSFSSVQGSSGMWRHMAKLWGISHEKMQKLLSEPWHHIKMVQYLFLLNNISNSNVINKKIIS